jgi:hypothetical protein
VRQPGSAVWQPGSAVWQPGSAEEATAVLVDDAGSVYGVHGVAGSKQSGDE